MVDRFLSWKLPEDFAPDGGVCFEGGGPIGTNLFTATQAEAMIRHLLEGLALPVTDGVWEALEFYAEPKNWESYTIYSTKKTETINPISNDNKGDKARAAISLRVSAPLPESPWRGMRSQVEVDPGPPKGFHIVDGFVIPIGWPLEDWQTFGSLLISNEPNEIKAKKVQALFAKNEESRQAMLPAAPESQKGGEDV
jgi:hypothetical protein